MPRKQYRDQARYLYRNRGISFLINESARGSKKYAVDGVRYDEETLGFGKTSFPRNPRMRPLLHKGKKP